MTALTNSKTPSGSKGSKRKEILVVGIIALLLIFLAPLLLNDFRMGLLGRFLSLSIVRPRH